MLYHEEVPEFITSLAATKPMLRLKQVGMNCGCEYTNFYRFRALAPYSRHTHSVGVALIVWHFTGSIAQAAAGLFHDISSPVFAHVVDFLNGDYLKQESTEAGTAQMIADSEQIQTILCRLSLTSQDVEDYHRYPLADNDAPRLSADRLEYTLGNLRNFGMASDAEIAEMYRDLRPYRDELAFATPRIAAAFAAKALACSKIYVSNEDRYAMQALAELLRSAISHGVLSREDLNTTEPQVIAKLTREPAFCARWQSFRQLSQIQCAASPQHGYIQVDAKKRYIDPLIIGQGRVSECFAQIGREQQAFLKMPLTDWLYAQ